jgi:GT2 family glycosyltransferase
LICWSKTVESGVVSQVFGPLDVIETNVDESSTATRSRQLLALTRLVIDCARQNPMIIFVDDLDWADSATVDWVMGAAMLIRREAFDAVGGFDERFFLYWEDADLCRRLRNRGWTTRYVPGAVVEHPGGRSSATARVMATREFHRSAYLYYATHVVPSPWHPLRWFARAALTARAWWRIAAQTLARP